MADPWEELRLKYSGAAQPEQAKDEWATLREKYSASVPESKPVEPLQKKQEPQGISGSGRFKRGLIDPIEGTAQLLYNTMPQPIQAVSDKVNNFLAEKLGITARIPEGGLNEAIRQKEQEYQAQRGGNGIDWARIGGNVLSPANLVAASKAAKLAPIAENLIGATGGKIASGAVGGAAQGAMMPTYSPDYWEGKGTQTLVGGGVGAALPILGKLLPTRSADAAKLEAAGIDVPIGQAIGGNLGKVTKSVEDKLTSIPLIGDAINMARAKSLNQFNIATINRALEPIGESLPKGIQPGRDAVSKAGEILSNAYNKVLPNLKVQADNEWNSAISQIKQMGQNLPTSEMEQLNRILANEVEGKFTSAGLMSGETLKQVESKLGQLARGYGRSEGYEKQQLSDALYQVQANLRALVERNNPMYAPYLQKVNQAYASLMRPERAASYVGAENGVFTPAQLLSSVKAADPSLRHKAFARGDAVMQDWAESAKNVLANKYPDSGTAGRMLLGGAGLTGVGQFVSPEAALLGAGITAAYLPVGKQVASGLLSASQGVSNTIANRSPYITPLLTPTLYGLLNPVAAP